uniref:E3 ubiquitin-protein ligase ZNRF1 n=1 Tax=Trichuris muris TaxID=70415 RepID=A0A5S6QA71_TRIMR
MGSRQSVSQPPRPRIPPTVTANGNGAEAYGTTNRAGAGSSSFSGVSDLHADLLSQVFSQTASRHGRSGRSNRSLSMPGPSVSPPLDNSSDSSDPDSSSAGLFSLDRWLNLSSSRPSGSGTATILVPTFSGRYFDLKCPVCHKIVPSDDVECHLVMCLTRPRITYNEDLLSEDKGECVICLDDMNRGDTIARLPCLCIYHKTCIDSWFKVRNSCPEHPGDD